MPQVPQEPVSQRDAADKSAPTSDFPSDHIFDVQPLKSIAMNIPLHAPKGTILYLLLQYDYE